MGRPAGGLARKGKILDEHCAAVGRDPKTITRSVNMALLITDKKDEIEQLAKTIETRMGRHAADARDTCLAGTPDQIREQLQQLKAAGASVLFIPSMFRPLPELRRDLDRFIAEIAPRVPLTQLRSSGRRALPGHPVGRDSTMGCAMIQRLAVVYPTISTSITSWLRTTAR